MTVKQLEEVCCVGMKFYINQHRLNWSATLGAWVDYDDEPEYFFTDEELGNREIVEISTDWNGKLVVVIQ